MSRTEFEVQSVSPTETPTSFEITLEGSAFFRSAVSQSIELFNYVTGAWEVVDIRDVSRLVDGTTIVAATGDLSRFVEPGTRFIRARIRYLSANPRQDFAVNTDRVCWTIGQ